MTAIEAKSWTTRFNLGLGLLGMAALFVPGAEVSAQEDVDHLIELAVLDSLPWWPHYIAFEPESAPLWTDDFTPALVASAVGVELPSAVIEEDEGLVYLDNGALLRLNRAVGYARYIGRDRTFDPEISTLALVDEGSTMGLTTSVLQQLGISMNEVGPIRIAPIMMSIEEEDGSTSIYTRETLVDIQRTIGGIPVIRSKIRIVVSNEGEVARLLIEWPDFEFAEQLDGIERSCQQIVAEIVDFAMLCTGGDVVPDIHLDLVYFPTGPSFASEYVPAVQVVVRDPKGGPSAVAFVPVVE